MNRLSAVLPPSFMVFGMYCGLRAAGELSFACCWKRRPVGAPLVGGELYSGLFL